MFYVKNGHDYELKQLNYLKSKGLPVPDVIAYMPSDTRVIATKDSGTSLEAFLEKRLSNKQKRHLMEDAALLLDKIHAGLSGIPQEYKRTSYKPTAHIVDNFFYKLPAEEHRIPYDIYEKYKNGQFKKSQVKKGDRAIKYIQHFLTTQSQTSSNNFHNSPLEMQHLMYLLDRVGLLFIRKFSAYTSDLEYKDESGETHHFLVCEAFDREPMYGDFKPENIVVKKEVERGLYCIDPEIMQGSRYFDLAKFINRYLIDCNSPQDRHFITYFLDAYGESLEITKPIYGPFTFLDLMAIDLLNLFKSLLKKYQMNDKSYRLVLQLDNPEFCNAITQLILNLQTIRTDDEFLSFLSGV